MHTLMLFSLGLTEEKKGQWVPHKGEKAGAEAQTLFGL